MAKQHLEAILSRTLKNNKMDCFKPEIWYMKIQNNPMAHKRTPADFIVLTEKYNILIECKETKTNSFSFDRITQDLDLQKFQNNLEKNYSYILICFWHNITKKSDLYIIDYKEFLSFKNKWPKKSITKKEARKEWTTKYYVQVLKNNNLEISYIY